MLLVPIVSCPKLRLDVQRMKSDSTSTFDARRASLTLAALLVFAFSTVFSHALNTVSFAPVQAQLTSDIETLAAIENPTRAQRALLKSMGKGTNTLAKTSVNDGKALKSLNKLLRRNPDYSVALSTVASNLLFTYNVEYDFVGGTLLPELPPSPEATAVAARFAKLAPSAARLNAATNIAKFAGLYDSAKRKLDDVFFTANQLLNFPFPSDLQTNSVEATINGVKFRASSVSATANQTGFQAVATETNITINLAAVGSIQRGIQFSVPNAQFGSFRYVIPTEATFVNRTNIDFFTGIGDDTSATEGAIFVGTTATEVYGIFMCSGPGFNVTDGRFRITISSQP